jgi:ABC-2 type transport system permease protein
MKLTTSRKLSGTRIDLRRFWSNVLAVAYREARLIRNPTMAGALILQPIVMLLLFGAVLSNKPRNVPWTVLDRSDTVVSRKLISDIQASGYFLRPISTTNYPEGRDLLHDGEALAMLVIPTDFAAEVAKGSARVQLLIDGSDPLSSARVAGYITAIAATFEPRPVADRRRGPATLPGAIDIRQRFRFNPTLRDRDFFLASIAGMVLTNVCFGATSIGLVGEKENGTYEQILSLPISATEVVIGKLLPHIVIAYALLVATMLASGLVFGVWVHGSPLALLIVTLPFVLASLTIGVLVSALARTTAQAIFITVFFTLPSFVLSGSMLPYQLMPHGVREFGAIFPLRWYQISLRRIMERGAGVTDVAIPLLALFAIFTLLLVTVRTRMKPRLG